MSESKRPTQAQRQRWKQAAMEQQAKMKEMIQSLAESYQETPENIAELLQCAKYHADLPAEPPCDVCAEL